MRLKTLLVIVALVMFVSVAPATFAQNLLTNGSFETGDFTGWTTGGSFNFTGVTTGAFYDYSGAEDGAYYVYMGSTAPATLSQTFADTAGAQYVFSFWFASVGDNPSAFAASWDGTQVLNLSNPNTGANWTEFSFTETGTGSDTVTFTFTDSPA